MTHKYCDVTRGLEDVMGELAGTILSCTHLRMKRGTDEAFVMPEIERHRLADVEMNLQRSLKELDKLMHRSTRWEAIEKQDAERREAEGIRQWEADRETDEERDLKLFSNVTSHALGGSDV